MSSDFRQVKHNKMDIVHESSYMLTQTDMVNNRRSRQQAHDTVTMETAGTK